MKPLIIVNFKTYKKATGKEALRLARICEDVSKKKKVKVMIAVQAADIYRISENVKIPVFSEHVDYEEPDAHTGAILVEDVRENGAIGSLLNHSERRLSFDVLKKTIERCKRVRLKTIVCARNINEAKKIAKLNPDYLAYEDPKLVGSGRAISKVKPKSVELFVKVIKGKKIVPLCGAGISNGDDVRTALKLGCKGILVASAVTKAKNPKKVLLNLVG